MIERELQKKCNEALKKMGVEFIHFDFAKNKKVCPVNFRGYPDLIIFFKSGKVLFIELKSETGELRDDQIEKHKRLLKLGYFKGFKK